MSSMIHPMFCILPPYMLAEIAQRGSQAQREKALQALESGEQIRAQRAMRTEVEALVKSTLVTGKQRAVFDAQNGSVLPGQLVRSEGDAPSGDPAVDEAYDGSGATYDLFKEVYDRESIDDQGMRLDSSVHYQQGYDNAFWNGQQMVYGDGDEDLPPGDRLFNRFTISMGIIGHELTHGVTQFTAALVYRSQPGALNESMSDVFGSLVKQRHRGESADQADWLIGEGLFTSRVNGQAIRSLKAPGTAYDDPLLGKDPQPAHMNDYQNVSYDNGGVHINSGIPNHAFYVTAREIAGNAWDKAGRIWYITLSRKLSPLAQFSDAARLTYQAAGELFGEGSLEQQAVRTGWAEVGLSVEEPGQGCMALIKSIFSPSGAGTADRG
jgi:Zn-dependent metalloprotease